MKLNKTLIILSLLLIFCISLGTVSATEDISVNDIDNGVATVESSINLDDGINAVNEGEIRNSSEIADEINTATGTYNIEYDYKIDKTWVIDGDNLIIEGKNHTIYGEGKLAFRINGKNVIIKNLNFINFSVFYGLGGAIYWNGVSGSVITCNFTNCSSSNGGSGGAIYWNSNGGSVSACNFDSCSSYRGGAICWGGEMGGAIGSVSACNFTNCSANGGSGGAIYWAGATGSVSGCSFEDCFANNGGAIYIEGSLKIYNCTCTPVDGDNKAPIYNDGTILSDVVITTIDGESKNVAYGDKVNITANVTASGIRVAGGILTLAIGNDFPKLSSNDEGLYSTSYTIEFYGVRTVYANYDGSTGKQSVISGELVSKLSPNLTVDSVFTTKGSSVDLIAHLNSNATGFVVFYVDDVEIGISRVINSIAKYTYTPTKVGEFTIKAVYEGDDKYFASNATSELTVDDNDNYFPTDNNSKINAVNNAIGNMENTGNPLVVLLIALISLPLIRRK